MTKRRYVYLLVSVIGYDRNLVAAYTSRPKAVAAQARLEKWDRGRAARPGYVSSVAAFEIKRMEVL